MVDIQATLSLYVGKAYTKYRDNFNNWGTEGPNKSINMVAKLQQ